MTLGNKTGIEGAVKPSAVEVDGFDPNLSAHRYTEIPSGLKMRIDYTGRSDGQPVYQGFAPSGLAEGTGGWLIYKFTYSADPGNMTQRDVFGASAADDANWTARDTYTFD